MKIPNPEPITFAAPKIFNIAVSRELSDAIKNAAKTEGIPQKEFIQRALVKAVTDAAASSSKG